MREDMRKRYGFAGAEERADYFEKRCDRLEKGLRDAIDMFRKYAEYHKEKHTEESDRKAQININFANALEMILKDDSL